MFTFSPTPLKNAYIITPQVYGDERGFFMETYSYREFHDAGIDIIFVQDNHSQSKAGVLRGLHFQTQNPQAKLVRVISGSVYDVAVDLRKNSPSFGQRYGVVLSAENKKQFYIPRGFAHGFITLEDDTEFVYKCDNFYDPISEGGIAWDDVTLNINWGEYFDLSKISLSKKDTLHPTFQDFIPNNPFLYE